MFYYNPIFPLLSRKQIGGEQIKNIKNKTFDLAHLESNALYFKGDGILEFSKSIS